MVGDAGLGEALEHPGIGVPRPRAGGERGGDFKRRKDLRHGNTLWSKTVFAQMRKHNPLAVKTRCGKTRRACIRRPRTQEKEEAPNGGSGASSVEFPAGTVMGGNAITEARTYAHFRREGDFFVKMVKVNNV